MHPRQRSLHTMTDRTRRCPCGKAPSCARPRCDAFRKLDPRVQVRNPVMCLVTVGSLLTTAVFVQDLATGTGNALFTGQVALWLWFTVLFANFAEAMAEGRGKAQANTLRKTRTETMAHRLDACGPCRARCRPRACARATSCACRPASSSRPTARSSRASRRWTSRRSPASPHRSSASPAAIAPPSPAAPACCRTSSSCASRPIQGTRSWIG